jgi:HPt (histidine-containing phosphotransfer) domain-containing protein
MIDMNRPLISTRAARACMLAALLAGISGCDFLDPTAVENPRTTDEDLAGAAEPTAALLPGLRAQFGRAINAVVTFTEVISDNYSIQGTGLDKALDEPAAVNPTLMNGGGGPYVNLQELRALSEFVLDDIVPGDDTATPEQIAEAQYYRGMAYLLLAENFAGAALEINEPIVAPAELLDRGIGSLEASLATSSDGSFALPARAALARAHRIAGNAAAAEAAALAVLAADANFTFIQEFDASSVDNGPHNFLVQRALQEMQPLPRLDFLDPKYTTEESGIPIAKAEEMHLILAEIDLVAGNGAGAREHVAQAIEIARARPTTGFDDNDLRRNADLTIRPRDQVILVRADAGSPFRADLVLDRPGQLQTPHISGTSLDADSVRALSGEEDLWHAFHLARQEILFLEGRRMSDLGVRLPIMLTEIDTNTAIEDGDPGTTTFVPAHIPTLDGMDLFSPSSPYTGSNPPVLETDEVTIDVDMNRLLAQGRVSPLN